MRQREKLPEPYATKASGMLPQTQRVVSRVSLRSLAQGLKVDTEFGNYRDQLSKKTERDRISRDIYAEMVTEIHSPLNQHHDRDS